MLKDIIKKIFDFIVSLAALIILSPLFLIISILIKMDSKGPVFFRQKRVGFKGNEFRVFKFRTMVDGAEEIGLGKTVSQNDSRITNIGKFLREWTIDEAPQFINILKGEMSFVGPRPLPAYDGTDPKMKEMWQKRVSVKPGLVSLVDIKGRNLVLWEKRLEYDNWYMENWSLGLDFKILFLGFFAVLTREGVYGEGGINKLPDEK